MVTLRTKNGDVEGSCKRSLRLTQPVAGAEGMFTFR